METRKSTVTRKTRETDIVLAVDLDGEGNADVHTGIGFFDHMLSSFARHGYFDLKLDAAGDLAVDTHHTVEDVGIVLGQALREAAGEKRGMNRYGSAVVPMDDALILCAVDFGGRPYFQMDLDFTVERVGELETETVREFFQAVSCSAGMNLHFVKIAGTNNHHLIEAMFKAFARALDTATGRDGRTTGVLSTKGIL